MEEVERKGSEGERKKDRRGEEEEEKGSATAHAQRTHTKKGKTMLVRG